MFLGQTTSWSYRHRQLQLATSTPTCLGTYLCSSQLLLNHLGSMWYNVFIHQHQECGGHLRKLLTVIQPSTVNQVLLNLLPHHVKNICHLFYYQFHWEIPDPFLLLSHTFFSLLLLVLLHSPLWKYAFFTQHKIMYSLT